MLTAALVAATDPGPVAEEFEIKSSAKISKSGGPLCDSITYLCHVVRAAKERSNCPSLDRSQSGVCGVGQWVTVNSHSETN